MSQMSTRRSRRQTTESEKSLTPQPEKAAATKPPTPQPETPPKASTPKPESPIKPPSTPPPAEKAPSAPPTPAPVEKIAKPPTPTTNGTEEPPPAEPESPPKSRSATPQLTNGHEPSTPTKDCEMDPLVIDEPDPELMFDESDHESVETPTRCWTRRSQSRNIPTPKTPGGEATPTEFNDSCDNASTKAVVGGDSTRLDYTESESFLNVAKSKSFGETLRRLSTRRTIRPISDEYRRRVVRKAELEGYPNRNSVERVVGVKRTNDSEEQEAKRFKSEPPGIFARWTSPLLTLKNTWRGGDIPSSTPKLTGYKDEKFLIEEGGICEVREGERRWCSIM